MQVYRGMDIGTAKPDPQLRSRVPHHLIDIRTPDEPYDVGAFVEDATAAIDAILARQRVPVVAGGTGFYFKHLMLGLPETPPSDPAVRARVRARAEREGLAALYEQLQQIDAETAQRVGPNDGYRITRALEVHEQTGRPLSSFAMTGRTPARLDAVALSLVRPRDELRRRIAERIDAMFDAGLRAEVDRLVASGYRPGDPGMRAIGYREFFDETGAIRPSSQDRAIAGEIVRDTRRYARRQTTFFRQIPDVREISADDVGAIAAIVDAIPDADDP